MHQEDRGRRGENYKNASFYIDVMEDWERQAGPAQGKRTAGVMHLTKHPKQTNKQ